MNPALITVYNTISSIMTDLFCYYQHSQMISEESRYNIVSQSAGTDIDLGDYVEYVIEPEEGLGIILVDRQINLTNKYQVTINNAYGELDIIKHTSTLTNDVIWVKNVPTIIHPSLPLEEATTLTLKLINSIYIESESIDINMQPPYKSLFGGERITISIKTKYDEDRTRLLSYEQQIISYIMNHYRKFDIYNGTTKVGYYKLIGLPEIQYSNGGNDYQESQIILNGFYVLKY